MYYLVSSKACRITGIRSRSPTNGFSLTWEVLQAAGDASPGGVGELMSAQIFLFYRENSGQELWGEVRRGGVLLNGLRPQVALEYMGQGLNSDTSARRKGGRALISQFERSPIQYRDAIRGSERTQGEKDACSTRDKSSPGHMPARN